MIFSVDPQNFHLSFKMFTGIWKLYGVAGTHSEKKIKLAVAVQTLNLSKNFCEPEIGHHKSYQYNIII